MNRDQKTVGWVLAGLFGFIGLATIALFASGVVTITVDLPPAAAGR